MLNNPISHWPIDDRPREKLLQKGEKHLSNSKLLSILLIGVFFCQPFSRIQRWFFSGAAGISLVIPAEAGIQNTQNI